MAITGSISRSDPVPGAGHVLRLSWPMALKAIFLHGTVVIDGWLVSPLGETALAAMGLGAAIGGFVAGGIFSVGFGLRWAVAGDSFFGSVCGGR